MGLLLMFIFHDPFLPDIFLRGEQLLKILNLIMQLGPLDLILFL